MTTPEINKISSAERHNIYRAFEVCFPDYAPITDSMRQFLEDVVKWDISYKAEQEGKIVGFYLVGERALSAAIAAENAVPLEDLSTYDSMQGVEGVALGVIPEFRKTGLTRALKQNVKSIPGLQYMYGLQYKSLGNLEYWLRSRRLVAESHTEEPVYITLEDIAK